MKLKITMNDKTYDVDVTETAMSGRLKVAVDGDSYEVCVEQYGGAPLAVAAAPAEQAPAPASAPAQSTLAPKPEPKHAAPAPLAPTANGYDGPGTSISAPMVGKILAVKVNPGDKVQTGDLLFLLEAMKMENEITSPSAGTVLTIAVAEGDTVKQGDLLCAIE